MMDLRAQRKALADAEYAAYSPFHFPGSAAWQKSQAALDALLAFDAQHPEIIAELMRKKLTIVDNKHVDA